MSLQYNLIVNPSSTLRSAINADLARLLTTQGVLSPANFLETDEQTPQTPAWLYFIQNSDDTQSASDLVFEQLSATNFSWLSDVMDTPRDKKAEIKTAFEAAFPYCSVNTVRQILAQLSSEDKARLQHNGLGSRRVSLLNALNHKRRDLADVLLENGWDLEQTDEHGATTLLRAPTWACAKQLLDCGANPLAYDHNQSTVWDRVQLWSDYQISPANIIQDLKKIIAPKGQSVSERKRSEAKDGMFHVVAEQKITNLSRRWASLQTHQNDGETLRDNAGRSFAQALCEKAMGYTVHEDNKDSLNFFFRVASFVHDAHHTNSWIDLDCPLDGFEGWTERDHVYTTLSMMLMDGRVNIKSLKENTVWSALETWHNQRFPGLVKDFDRWYQTFNRLDTQKSKDRMYSLVQLNERNAHEPWKRLQRALLTLPPDNSWCQRILSPFDVVIKNAREGGVWSGGPAYHSDWLATWAVCNNISVDNPVWDILTTKALYTMTSEMVSRGRSVNGVLSSFPYIKTVLDNNLHKRPENKKLLKVWMDDLLVPPTGYSYREQLSKFENNKNKMSQETLAFFSKLFLDAELDNVLNATQRTTVGRKM